MKNKISVIKLILPALTLKAALAKFQGIQTPATILAARRMVAKPQFVQIPKTLVAKFWQLTGGWEAKLNEPVSVGASPPELDFSDSFNAFLIGDLTVVFRKPRYGEATLYLCYRNQIASCSTQYYKKDAGKNWRGEAESNNVSIWLQPSKVEELLTVWPKLEKNQAIQLGFKIKANS